MVFEPEYGEALASDEERGALTSQVREILGEPVRKAAVGLQLGDRPGRVHPPTSAVRRDSRCHRAG